MKFKGMDDVRQSDGDAIVEMASDPRFFYVYLNSGGRDPVEAGLEYAGLCELAVQHRTVNAPLPEELPWQAAWAKGLRDEQGKLMGVVVLLHEKGGETEIGYFLHPDLHGQGLGPKMAMSALKWARENTDINILKGDVDPANITSRKMLAKMGLEVAEYHDVGPYTDKNGKSLPSMIMKGGTTAVDAALRSYEQGGGSYFSVTDVAPSRQQPGAPAPQGSNPTL